jgi:hypothetical protein
MHNDYVDKIFKEKKNDRKRIIIIIEKKVLDKYTQEYPAMSS